MTKAPTAKLLIEHHIPGPTGAFEIIEEKQGKYGPIMIVEGEFAFADRATANKRKYPRKVLEAQIKRLNKALSERRVLGELDHPEDSRTKLQRVSHVLTALRLEDNGRVIGRSEVLDTERGRTLQSLLKAKCKVGVSSRGFGSTIPNDQGEEVVQEDYSLQTFDFVADPADQDAYPDVVFEGVDPATGNPIVEETPIVPVPVVASKPATTSMEEVRKLERERVTAQLREQFATDLLAKTSEIKASVREEVLQECLSDPKIAGALSALGKIKDALKPFGGVEVGDVSVQEDSQLREAYEEKLKDKDLQIEELSTALSNAEAKIEEYATVAREAGYNLYMERTLSLDPDGDLIRRVVGDVMQYVTLESLESRVEGVREELKKYREEENLRQETRRQEEELQRKRVEEERLRNAKEVEALKSQLSEALQLLKKITDEQRSLATENKQLQAQVYAEQRLQATKASPRLRDLVKEQKVTTEEQVDRLVEETRTTPVVMDQQQLDAARNRVRSFQRQPSIVPTALDESRVAKEPVQNGHTLNRLADLGTSMGEIDRLTR